MEFLKANTQSSCKEFGVSVDEKREKNLEEFGQNLGIKEIKTFQSPSKSLKVKLKLFDFQADKLNLED